MWKRRQDVVAAGLYAQGNWLKNTDNGEQTGGVGAGYNLILGLAFPVGGGARIKLINGFALYGEGYIAPDGFSNSVRNYTEANAGVSW
jgi:hypothetical protein